MSIVSRFPVAGIITSFRFFPVSIRVDSWFTFASVTFDSFCDLPCLFGPPPSNRSPGCCFVGRGRSLASIREGGLFDSSFFFGGPDVRATSVVLDSLPTFVCTFLAALAAIDRAFASLCFRRLVFISSNLATCTRVAWYVNVANRWEKKEV